jgi:hypothetical protein
MYHFGLLAHFDSLIILTFVIKHFLKKDSVVLLQFDASRRLKVDD